MSTTIARQPLKMATNTRRLTTVLTVSPPSSVRMYDIGVSAPMSPDSEGAPRMAAVTGMSSTASVIASVQRMARATDWRARLVSSEKTMAAP